MTDPSRIVDSAPSESRDPNAPETRGPGPVEFDENVKISEPRRMPRLARRTEASRTESARIVADRGEGPNLTLVPTPPAAPPADAETEHYGPLRTAALSIDDAKRIAAQAHVVAQTGSTLGTWNPAQRRAKKKAAEEAARRLEAIREQQERQRTEKAEKAAARAAEKAERDRLDREKAEREKAERPAKEPKAPKPPKAQLTIKVTDPVDVTAAPAPAGKPVQLPPPPPPIAKLPPPPPAPVAPVPAQAVVIDKSATAKEDAARKAEEKAAAKRAAAEFRIAAAQAKKDSKAAEKEAAAQAAQAKQDARAAAKVQVVEEAPAPPSAPTPQPNLADSKAEKPKRDWHAIFFGTPKRPAEAPASAEVVTEDIESGGMKTRGAKDREKAPKRRGKRAHDGMQAKVFNPKARENSGAVGPTVHVTNTDTVAVPPPRRPELQTEVAPPTPEPMKGPDRVSIFAPVSGGAVRPVNQPRGDGLAPLVAPEPVQAVAQAPSGPTWDPQFMPPQLIGTMNEDTNWMRIRRPSPACLAALQQTYVRVLVPQDPIVGVVLRAVSRALKPGPISADQIAYNAAVKPSGGRRRKDGPPILGAEGAREAAALGRRIESGQGGSLINAADAAELIARLSDTWDVAAVLRHPEITTWAYDEAVTNIQASPRPRRGKGPDKKKVLAELSEAKRILDGVQAEQLIATTHV